MLSRDIARKLPRPNLLWVLGKRLKEHPLARVGPGLITGVADDDPSGIATYSQAGAQFGLNMLWTMPLAFPLMAAVQSMCARIGRVTGKGLAANIKDAFHPVVLYGVVLLLLVGEYLQYRRRHRRHGRGRGTRHRVSSPVDDDRLRAGDPAASGVRSLSPLRRLPEVADALAAGLCGGAVHGSRPLGPGGAAHLLAPPHAERRRPRWWSASSAPPSAPTSSSGRPPRKWRTCRTTTARRRSLRDGRAAALNSAASAGIPGAACSTPTDGLFHHSGDCGHVERGRHNGHRNGGTGGKRVAAAWPAISPSCCSRSAFWASA